MRRFLMQLNSLEPSTWLESTPERHATRDSNMPTALGPGSIVRLETRLSEESPFLWNNFFCRVVSLSPGFIDLERFMIDLGFPQQGVSNSLLATVTGVRKTASIVHGPGAGEATRLTQSQGWSGRGGITVPLPLNLAVPLGFFVDPNDDEPARVVYLAPAALLVTEFTDFRFQPKYKLTAAQKVSPQICGQFDTISATVEWGAWSPKSQAFTRCNQVRVGRYWTTQSRRRVAWMDFTPWP